MATIKRKKQAVAVVALSGSAPIKITAFLVDKKKEISFPLSTQPNQTTTKTVEKPLKIRRRRKNLIARLPSSDCDCEQQKY